MAQNILNSIKTLFLACLFVVASEAAAQGCSPCCTSNDCCCEPECFCRFPNFDPCCKGIGNRFLITGEFLWWTPCFNNLDYAIFTDDLGLVGNVVFEDDSYQNVQHQWMPGFRVGLEIDQVYCNWDLRFNYTWFQGKDKQDVKGQLGYATPTIFHPGTITFFESFNQITGSHKYQYQTFEIQFGQTFKLACCHRLFPFFGLEGVKLDQVIKSNGIEADVTRAKVRWESCYEALGLEIGADYRFHLLSGLEFFAQGTFTVVGGCSKSVNRQEDVNDSRIVFFNTDDKICTPGLHLKAGADYTIESCGHEFLVTIGYEFIEWFNMPQIRRFLSDSSESIGLSTSVNGSRIGFHGLFVGVGFSI